MDDVISLPDTRSYDNFFNRHASEKTKLLGEINSLKELLNTYEKSIERKDQVISNLTNALQKQKDKNEMMRKFCDWKIKHNDVKREVSEAFNPSPTWVLYDLLVTVKAVPHEFVIRIGQP